MIATREKVAFDTEKLYVLSEDIASNMTAFLSEFSDKKALSEKAEKMIEADVLQKLQSSETTTELMTSFGTVVNAISFENLIYEDAKNIQDSLTFYWVIQQILE